MRNVTLYGTDITTTALGFGTASLMGKLDRRASLRLLATAYEQGIRHFDTAPLYGYGESEAVLGAFLRTHTAVTVTTKFGLSFPQTRSPFFNPLKQIARPILRAVPSLRNAAHKAVVSQAPQVPRFDVAAAGKSLASSLKLLQRNYVDIYLLHECRAADLDNDELFDFLGAQRAKGLIRAFGIGTDIATVVHSARSAPNFAHVVQFANNPQEPNLERSPALASEHACITHTPFGGVGQTAHIESGSALQYAARHNPNGIILFGSQSEGHIASNVRAFT